MIIHKGSFIAAGLTGVLVFAKLLYVLSYNQFLFFGGHKQPDFEHDTPSRQEVRRKLGGLPDAHLLSPKEKQAYIKDAFLFSWQGYCNYSWGFDENRPDTNSPRNTR